MNIGDEISLPQLADSIGASTIEFRIANVLSGGMGRCLNVVHSDFDRSFAVKIIHSNLLNSDSAWLRFIDELEIWFVLSQSTGVVEAICMDVLNEVPCMCSPWMEGGTLRDGISARTLSPATALTSLHRVARTLEWVHTEHKTIHRDLKPENILFDRNGSAYVSDWGIAKLSNRYIEKRSTDAKNTPSSPGITHEGTFLGTIVYASPEQIQGRKDIDHRSDIYSLGCIMYEMETHGPPFSGRTVEEIALQHLRAEPPRLGGFLRRTTLGLESIIQRCMQKDPAHRYQSYDELITDLSRICAKKGVRVRREFPSLREWRPYLGTGDLKRTLFRRIAEQVKAKSDRPVRLFEFDELKPYFEEFSALASLGQWQKALEIIKPFYVPDLSAAQKVWHFGHDLAVNYALCLTKTGEAAAAVCVLSPMAKMVDPPATYYVNYSLALLHTHSYEAAEAICRNGLNRFPKDNDLLGNYIHALGAQKKLSQALRELNVLLSRRRDVHSLETAASLMNDLGSEAGDSDWAKCVQYKKQALEFLKEAKEQNPRFATARLSLASTLWELGQFQAALEEYWDVAKICGKGSILTDLAVGRIARILLELNGADQCVEFYKTWLPEVSEKTELTRAMSMAVTERYVMDHGQPVVVRQALEFFEHAVTTDNSRVEDYCYLADLYARLGRNEETQSLLTQARYRFPKCWLVPYYEGFLYFRNEEHDLAIRALEEASRLAPMQSEPDWKLAQLYSRCGDAQRADHFKQQAKAKKESRKAIVDRALRST